MAKEWGIHPPNTHILYRPAISFNLPLQSHDKSPPPSLKPPTSFTSTPRRQHPLATPFARTPPSPAATPVRPASSNGLGRDERRTSREPESKWQFGVIAEHAVRRGNVKSVKVKVAHWWVECDHNGWVAGGAACKVSECPSEKTPGATARLALKSRVQAGHHLMDQQEEEKKTVSLTFWFSVTTAMLLTRTTVRVTSSPPGCVKKNNPLANVYSAHLVIAAP